MPSLKDIHCTIELSNGKGQLREFGATYRDGGVETFVAVPESSKPFTVHVKSSSFIAPGLAMYVFIDGVYQCNRNRQNLKLQQPLGRKSLVDFIVRQKEERQEDGSMMATEWSLAMLDLESADKAPKMCSFNLTDNIGCIEVIVIRCTGTRSAKCAPKGDTKGINLDGANDLPDDWGFHARGNPQHDDRSWQHVGPNAHPSRYSASTRVSSNHNPSPPPPLPSYSYLANTHHESPVFRQGSDNFVPGYRYGRGPIAHQSRVPSNDDPSIARDGAPVIDLAWLDKRLADAVNRGFEKYHSSKASPKTQPVPAVPAVGYSVPAPGAWPSLPEVPVLDTDPNAQSHQSNAHVSWNPPLPAGAQNDEKGYYSISETGSSESWGGQRYNGKQGSVNRERQPDYDSRGWASAAPQQSSPAICSYQTGDWTRLSDFHSARSRLQEPVWESRSDKDGWTIVDAGSGHNPWTLPRSVHPSENISVAIPASDTLARKLRSISMRDDKCQRRSVSAAQSTNWESMPRWGALKADDSLAGVPPFSTAGYAWETSMEQRSKTKAAAPTDSDKGWSTVERAVSPIGWGTDEAKPTRWDTEKVKCTGWEAEGAKVTGWGDTENSSSWDTETTEPSSWEIEAAKATEWDIKAGKPSGWDTEEAKSASWDTGRRRVLPWWETLETNVTGWDSADAKPAGWDIEETKATHRPEKGAPPALFKVEHKRQHKTATHNPTKQASISRWLIPEPTSKTLKLDSWTTSRIPANPVPSTQKLKYTATPTRYEHPIGRPIYIDSLEKPYASFVFKYRSHKYLQSHLGPEVPSSLSLCVKALSEPFREVAKREMQDVPRDKLIEKLVALEGEVKKAKEKAKEKHKTVTERDEEAECGEDSKTEIEMRKRTKEWVEKMS